MHQKQRMLVNAEDRSRAFDVERRVRIWGSPHQSHQRRNGSGHVVGSCWLMCFGIMEDGTGMNVDSVEETHMESENHWFVEDDIMEVTWPMGNQSIASRRSRSKMEVEHVPLEDYFSTSMLASRSVAQICSPFWSVWACLGWVLTTWKILEVLLHVFASCE